MNQQIEQAFSDLNTRVAAIESSEAAATALLVGLNEQLQAALNSSEDPTEVVNSIQAISDRLNTDAQNLAAAVAANTPATGGEATDPTSGDDTTGTEGDATDPTQG